MPNMPLPVRLLLAFSCGIAMPFAFAPYRRVGLAVLALAGLLWLARQRPVLTAYVFGLGWFAVGAWWLAPTVHQFGGLSWGLAALVVMLVGAVLAVFPALWMGVSQALIRRSAHPATALLIFPIVMVAVEWLRGHVFTGLPWISLGNLLVDTPAVGWLAVIGVYGAAAWSVAWAACLAGLLERHVRSSALAGLVVLVGITFVAPGVHMPDAPSLKAALIQPNIPQDHKWDARFLSSTMNTLTQLSAQHAGQVSLMIWPEVAVPFYLEGNPTWRQWLYGQMQSWRTPVVFGGLKYFPENKTSQNGLYLFANDRLQGFAGKHHLVPFGEYVPSWLPWLHKLVPDIGDFRAAKDDGVLRVGRQVVGSLICYESIFPEEARARVQAGANVLVLVTNDAWYGTSPAAWQHLQAAQVRAVETGRYVLRAANTGVSAMIAPNGQVTATIPWWTTAALLGEYQLSDVQTLYQRWGDMWAWLMVLGGLGLVAALNMRAGHVSLQV